MYFNSSYFLFAFLPLLLFVYYISPKKIRNALLVTASFIFYVFGGTIYILLLFASIAVNYLAGIVMDKTEGRKRLRKCLFVIFLVANLMPLFYFKYFNFSISSIDKALQLTIPQHSVALPLGISFFTFKALSYILVSTDRFGSYYALCGYAGAA